MAAYVYISAVWKCALVSTMPAASTLQRRGVTLSTLWVWYELMTFLEIDNLLIEWVVFQSLIWTDETCGQVSKIVRHPQFDAKRLSDDIAVMITSRVVGEEFWWKHQQNCWFPLSQYQAWKHQEDKTRQYCFPLQTCSTPMSPLPAFPPASSSLIMSSATAQEQGSVFRIICTIV